MYTKFLCPAPNMMQGDFHYANGSAPYLLSPDVPILINQYNGQMMLVRDNTTTAAMSNPKPGVPSVIINTTIRE